MTITPENTRPSFQLCGLPVKQACGDRASAASVKTQDNIGEGQPTSTSVEGRNPRVFVISQRGQPLMPTCPQKARKLLKEGKAKVIRRTPFIIQLLCATGETKQDISLGVDIGTKHIGLSATTAKSVLFEAEVLLRADIQDLLATKRMFRNHRRGQKTRYRKARFLNRKKYKGWLAPSVQNKVDMHIKVVQFVSKFLPAFTPVVEIAQFDIQKINNPDIVGIEYQEGPQLNYENVKAYCLARDGHTCAHCRGKSKDKRLNVHHIETRKTGGDGPGNLITLCKTCHSLIHTSGLTPKFKRGRSFREETHMNIVCKFVYAAFKRLYPATKFTYGYITKYVRKINGLDKTHTIDARCISGNPNANVTRSYVIKQTRGQNRQLHRATFAKGGKRQATKTTRYVFGFQLFDRVKYKGHEYFIFGRRNSGYFDLRLGDGTRMHTNANYRKIILVEKAKTLLVSLNCK